MVRSQALLGGLVVVLGLFVVGLTTYSVMNRGVSQDTRSQAAITSCSGQPESICKATLGCRWIPSQTTTTTPQTCTNADCDSGKIGCSWETITGSKGVCSGGTNSRTGEDCMLIINPSSCTGGCTWTYPSQKICQGSYTTSSTTAAKCEGTPRCPDPCTSHANCGSGFYCDSSSTCPTCRIQVCTPNQAMSCTDGWLKVCNSVGSSIVTQTKCDYGCNSAGTACMDPPVTNKCPDGGCTSDSDCSVNQYCYQPSTGCAECRTKTSTCTPDTFRCKDNTYVERCTVSGSWIAEKCPAGCNQSTNRCNTICNPGAYRCDGQKLQECSHLGDWVTKQTCVSGTSCNDQTVSCQPIVSPTPPGNSSLLPDKSPCSSPDQCQSNNCQSTPFGRVCLAAGTSLGEYTVKQEGAFCGSNSFGVYACDTNLGLKCVDGACFKLKANNQPCSTPNQCQSGNCQLTQSGRICLAAGMTVSAPVAANGPCGTTAYNRECVSGYSCQQNQCKLIPTEQAPTNLMALAQTCATNPSLPACQQQTQAYEPSVESTPKTNQEMGIAALQTLNTVTFGALGNYVASNVEQNQTYGYGTDNYDYWQRVANYENIRVATNLGATLVGEVAVGAYAGAAAAGTMSIGTALAGGASTANFLFSTANTASVCQTPQDFLNNSMCQMAGAQNITAGLGFASLGTSVAAKTVSLAANMADTTLGGVNTFNYCKEYGPNGTCLLFGATTALGAVGTGFDAWQLNKYSNGLNNIPTSNLTVVAEDALTGTDFAEGAAASVVNSQYVSSKGTQRVIIDPNYDVELRNYLADAKTYVATNRTSRKISRVSLLQKYVTETFPDYNIGAQWYSVEQVKISQQELYQMNSGTVNLGEFVRCKTAVCREQSLLLHTALADSGKFSEVVTGSTKGGRSKHAWVEFVDTITGKRMVADSVWGFVLPAEQAYDLYGGVTNTSSQVFVIP